MKPPIMPLLGLVTLAVSMVASPGPATATMRLMGSSAKPFCETHIDVCPDTFSNRNYEGQYVGHDEPAVNFYSDQPNAGNSNTWRLRLPHESPVLPTQNGRGGTWNFQLHPIFWFGMALCETQSYPNPGVPCQADSNANIKDDSDPNSPNWIGNHVGTGFLELQFYPPGYVGQFTGFSCDATRWCAAMVLFGLSRSLTQTNNTDCLSRAGEEWANFAYVTRSGVPQGPPDPLNFDFVGSGKPGPTVLSMNAGDELAISIRDSSAGLLTSVTDTTSSQTGSMTASAANGFAHPLFQPSASTCAEEPYSFHPMYSTASEHTRVPWAAHSSNVAFSDEIGHFEYCKQADVLGNCVVHGVNDPKIDADDIGCFNPSASLLIQVGGCFGSEIDFDGPAYQRSWPGTLGDPTRDRQQHAESFLFTSPLSNGKNYHRMAFETDLPAIESGCNTLTGVGCVNPPLGAKFYPIYSTTGRDACAWQEGGTHIPGTTNTFGGTSTSEYGPPLTLVYPPSPGLSGNQTLVSDFRNVLSSNPCKSNGQLPEPDNEDYQAYR